ncbi:NAD(P)-dependent oxidoreductase [Ruania zhangjianzhongii]|uniref:NAD(P)-dependent oxidoreductase n=1 Tax=Ruania zhangjianzhongii TaxID=2603206 RepID=UPI0011CC74CB|nr:NAD(P)-dependent oxidoreductase [Ruania zhangjianzhongii]
MDANSARIGVIGLGTMGAEMAQHIAAEHAGTGVLVHSRRRESAADAEAAGAHWAATPAEIGASCAVVVTVLPDLPELEQVLAGSDGLLAGLTRPTGPAGQDRRATPTVLVICSTSSPGGVRRMAADLEARTGGLLHCVDAPLSGGREGATAATLSIFAGGSAADVATATPALAPCGRVVHLGPLGAGQVAKACNQLIVAATTVALAESAVLAERSGLDLAALFDILGGGYAGSRLLEVKADKLTHRDHSPDSPARLMIKDLQFVLDEAETTGTPDEHVRLLQDLYRQVVGAGLGDLDSTVVQRYLAER